MGYRGQPEFYDVPLPGDDDPCLTLDRGRDEVDHVVEELLEEGRMRKTASGYWGPAQPMPAHAEHYEPFPNELVPATVAIVPPPRDVFEQVREKGLKLLWQYGGLEADGSVQARSPAFNGGYLLNTSSEQEDNRTRSWEIHVWAYEMQRILPAGSPPVPPQNFDSTPRNQFSRLRVRIACHGTTGGMVRDVDIGAGLRFTMRAAKVVLYLLYPQPANLSVFEGGQPIVGLGGGLVLDTQIGSVIAQSDTVPGVQTGTLTETFTVPGGTADAPFFVPPGARRVSIYQTGAGGVATMEWRLLRDALLPGPSLGQISLGPARRAERIDRIGNAGMITSGPPDGAIRTFTLVWEIDI